jgi:hypothetical protein
MDLEKLKELNAAASPGPWSLSTIGLTNAGARAIISAENRIGEVDIVSEFKRGDGWKSPCAKRDANAALIAFLRNSVDEVLRLTAERDAAVAASQKLATENARLVEREAKARELVNAATEWNWLDYWRLCETDEGMNEAKITLPDLWWLDDEITAFLAGGTL